MCIRDSLEAVLGQALGAREPGVVEQDVERLAAVEERLRRGLHRREVGKIELQEVCLAAGRADLVDHGPRPFLGSAREDQVRAQLSQGEGRRATDPGVRARDEDGSPRLALGHGRGG